MAFAKFDVRGAGLIDCRFSASLDFEEVCGHGFWVDCRIEGAFKGSKVLVSVLEPTLLMLFLGCFLPGRNEG